MRIPSGEDYEKEATSDKNDNHACGNEKLYRRLRFLLLRHCGFEGAGET